MNTLNLIVPFSQLEVYDNSGLWDKILKNDKMASSQILGSDIFIAKE